MRLHHRHIAVRQAHFDLESALWELQKMLGMDYASMLVLLAAYTTVLLYEMYGEGLVPVLQQPAGPPARSEVLDQLVQIVATVCQKHTTLTRTELLTLLADHQARIAGFMLKLERQPGRKRPMR